MIPDQVTRIVERALSATLRSARALSGGDTSSAARLFTSAGSYFVKWDDRPLLDQFEREASGLRALSAAQRELRCPEVIFTSPLAEGQPALIILEWVEAVSSHPDFNARLGRGLAALHQVTQARFGFEHDTYCGASLQPNAWRDDWPTFYVEQRLAPLIRRSSDERGLSTSGRVRLERLLARLPELLASDEPPALIHGDLWSGNVLIDPAGRPVLIDPAVYYGHREAELGMMSLFGHLSEEVWRSYERAYPLSAGWRARLPLYELYHVLNHYVLFGGGYRAQALQICDRYL